jgi:probable phosphoglycerate mutase
MPGPGGESLEDVRARVVPALENAAMKYDGDICLVSHDAAIKVILCHVTGAPLSSFWKFLVPNCSLSIVEYRADGASRLNLLGDISFLVGDFEAPEQRGL